MQNHPTWCETLDLCSVGCPADPSQTLAIDLLHPSAEHEAKQYKLKRLVQSPNSYFMDVKCPGECPFPRQGYVSTEPGPYAIEKYSCFPHFYTGCFAITTVFSHAQTVVVCPSCTSVLCQPTGGKARLTEGASFSPTFLLLMVSILFSSRMLFP